MIKIEKYVSSKEELWNNFLYKSKTPVFLFDRGYMEYHSDRYKDNSLLFYNDKDLIAIFPANLGKNNELYSHGGLTFGGFVCSKDIKQYKMILCFQALQKYMTENKIQSLHYKNIPHMYHVYPAEEDLYGLFFSGAQVEKIEASTVIDLSCPIKFPKGRKAQISRAKRENVIVEESDNFEEFIKLENDVLKHYHETTAVHTGKEILSLYRKFPNNIKLFVAKYQNKIVAGSIIFVYSNLIHTQYMAANECARQLGALDLVIYTIINLYVDKKRWLDFGKSTENDGKNLNEGLIAQKESFGGRTNIYQTWLLKI